MFDFTRYTCWGFGPEFVSKYQFVTKHAIEGATTTGFDGSRRPVSLDNFGAPITLEIIEIPGWIREEVKILEKRPVFGPPDLTALPINNPWDILFSLRLYELDQGIIPFAYHHNICS
jgi:hypothetical protein